MVFQEGRRPMTNNARPLTDERLLLDAETKLGADERKAWERLERAFVDVNAARGNELASRLAKVAALPDAPAALVTQAREYSIPVVPENMPGQTERDLALTARRGALQARELAVRAIERDVVALEDAHARRAKALDELRGLVDGIEKAANQAALARAEAEREEARRKAEEEARKVVEPTPTIPAMPAFDPGATIPGVPAFSGVEEATTDPEMPAISVPAKTMPFVQASNASAPATISSPPASRRRAGRKKKVRLAPPPKRLEVEVAEYGDDTFYTGWNRTISDGGLFVVSLETLPPGHELDVEINLDGRTIRSRGRVQFNRRVNPTNPDCESGAGIKLLNLTRENTQAIESFFSERAPLFFVER